MLMCTSLQWVFFLQFCLLSSKQPPLNKIKSPNTLPLLTFSCVFQYLRTFWNLANQQKSQHVQASESKEPHTQPWILSPIQSLQTSKIIINTNPLVPLEARSVSDSSPPDRNFSSPSFVLIAVYWEENRKHLWRQMVLERDNQCTIQNVHTCTWTPTQYHAEISLVGLNQGAENLTFKTAS